MTKLDAALAWAARGFRIFPLLPNSKVPAIDGWTVAASTAPEAIRAWWTDPVTGTDRDYNIGVLTSALVVVDVDVKKGKPGIQTAESLGLALDCTLKVRTPTGGAHLYHLGIGREVGQSPLGPGIDVRSKNGFVAGPGSTIDGVAYEVELDLPVAVFPPELRHLLKAPRERAQRGAVHVGVELDLPENLEIAAHWLGHEAPVAIEGQNGNNCTYRVACHVRDRGLSEVAALDEMLDHWNPRCEPPWPVDELCQIVENAFAYAKNEAGCASPEAQFGHVVFVEQRGNAKSREDHGTAHDATALHRPPMASDEALALRYAAAHADDLRHVAKWSQWRIWLDGRWQEDATLKAFDAARGLCREVAAGCNEPHTAKSVASARTVYAVQQLARSDRRLAATIDQWDADLDLLNTPGGAVDLRSGSLRVHARRDYCTKMTAAAPAPPGASCPLWMKFLRRVTRGDEALMTYLQRVVGYCLTGSVKEHALFFAHGTGRNGKSVFLGTIAGMLGDYAATAAMDTFVASRGDRHPTDLAMLRGARLVTASETEEGREWAEARIKEITGGDRVTARFMRQDFFTYEPQFKLLIAGNHRPRLRGVDEAIKARFNMIPFNEFIPANERDRDLPEKLKAEWPAILRWAIDGCLEWGRVGLEPPPVVRAATEEYLADEDAVALWLNECCERSALCWESSANLFASWKRWAEKAGEEVGSQRKLSHALKQRHLNDTRQAGTGQRGYEGIRLKGPRGCDA